MKTVIILLAILLIFAILNFFFTLILHKIKQMTDQEILDKLDALQATVDAHQEQDAATVAELQKTIDELRATQNDPAVNQQIADRLDALKTDIEGNAV